MADYVQGDPIDGNDVGTRQNRGSDDKSVPVKVGKYDSLTLFEVSEEEMQVLENGESNMELNLAIAVASSFITIIIALFTSQMTDIVKAIFIACAIAFLLLFVYFIWGWRKKASEFQKTILKIRNRFKV